MKQTKKERETEEKLAAMSQVDPFSEGYRPGSGVTVPAEVFMAMLDFSGYVAQTEQKEMVELTSFKMGEQPGDKGEETIRIYTSGMGKKGDQLFNELMSIHYENIDKGVTVNHNVGVELDLGDGPNK